MAKKAAKTSKKKKASPKKKAAKKAVTIDRREKAGKSDRRKGEDRRKTDKPVATERRKLKRRAKVNRRRQIDPTTCERDYTDEEVEFMQAMDQYKRASGRMFPTCSEVLEVIRNLGYAKQAPGTTLPGAPAPEPAETTETNVEEDTVESNEDFAAAIEDELI